MSSLAGDFSSQYQTWGLLFATSTGVSTSANAQGTSADISNDDGNVMTATLIVGNAAGTTPTMNMKVIESTDGTTYTDVVDGAFTQVTTSNQIQALPVKPRLRYVSVTGTVAGTNPVFEATVVIVGARRSPASYGGFSNAVAPG